MEDHAVHAQVAVRMAVSALLGFLGLVVVVVIVNACTAKTLVRMTLRLESPQWRVLSRILNRVNIQRILRILCVCWRVRIRSHSLNNLLSKAGWMNVDIWS